MLRNNVRLLLGLAEGESGVQRLIDKGYTNGTAQRILGGETSIGLDIVDRLAATFGVPAWRLLAPNLGRAEPAGLDELTPHEALLIGFLRQRGREAVRAELTRLQSGEDRPEASAPIPLRAATKRP